MKIFNQRFFSTYGPARVSPEETRQKVVFGSALLVCAYDSDEKFKRVQLEGAVSLNEFRDRLPALHTGHEMIFYCSCFREESAAGQAVKYTEQGSTNVKVLDSEVKAWENAGYPVV